MKIKITINLDNFENVSIESSEHDTGRDCVAEIKGTKELFRGRHVPGFMDRVFGRA